MWGDDIHEHDDNEGVDLVAVAAAGADHLVTDAVTDDDGGVVEEGRDTDHLAHDDNEG